MDLRQEISILFLVVLTLAALLSKFVGGFAASKAFGMKKKEAMIVGVGMAPRGEIALIIALLGLNAGVLKQEVYATLVLMALLTTIVTPILLKRLYEKS